MDSSFWQYKDYADIHKGFLEKGATNNSGVVKNGNFGVSAFGCYLRTLGDKAKIIIW